MWCPMGNDPVTWTDIAASPPPYVSELSTSSYTRQVWRVGTDPYVMITLPSIVAGRAVEGVDDVVGSCRRSQGSARGPYGGSARGHPVALGTGDRRDTREDLR